MKQKITLLFALLCASVMGWAIDWTDETTNPYVPGSTVYQIAGFTGSSVVNVQTNWGHEGIYVTFPVGLTSCSLGEEGCHIEGAGLLMYLTALTALETEVTVVDGNSTNYVFTVHNNTASTPDPDPATISINKTDFFGSGWVADNESSATIENGVVTVTMVPAHNAQWQAQVWLNSGVTYAVGKYYDFSFKFHSNNAVGGVTVKTSNNNALFYDPDISLPANEDFVYTKSDVDGVAGDNIIVFDFGYAPANTTITISEISITEKNAPSVVPVVEPYCSKATGHLGNAAYGDANGRILLTLTKKSNSSVGVKVEPNNGGIDVFDFVQVELNGVAQTLGTVGGSVPTTSEIVYDGLASLDFNINILWHHSTWDAAGGRWTTNQFSVTEAELCPAPVESEYCGYQGSETQQDGHYFAITFETDPSGNVVVTIGNGTGAGACSFRNGGFEGGNNGLDNFVVSDDNFATTSPATDYFTVTRPTDGDLQYVLTKTADLPANAKIKHLTAGAIAWREAGVDRWCFPEFIYTYGAICTEEPELTSIALSASASIAQVGSGITLTATPLDQFGAPIEATINYAISPADAGSISGNVFTFAKTGAATITASSGAVEESITLYCVSSANIALNKTCEGGYEDGNAAEIAAKANDGNESSAWVTWSWQDPSVEWWYVDLSALYDITSISVLWGADYSSNYILQVRDEAPAEEDKANDAAWTTIATVTSATANNIAMNYVTTTGRYVRLHSLTRSTGAACIRLRELQVFGSEAATPTKFVSATPNDPSMGTATVKQGGVDVTEVETGTTVTFSAVANEGYIFVNWSNGNTNASFDAEVNESMNLTANFRALGTTYCNTLVHSSNGGQEHDAYVTMKRTAANTYQLIVRAEYQLGNFSNTEFRIKEEGAANTSNFNLNNKGVLTNGNHVLTGTLTSTIEPEMISGKLYVNIVGKYEGQFDKLTNIEFSESCEDPQVSDITLNRTSANLLIGHTLTLIPTFTPVYATDNALTWETSNSSIATVDNGVVTGVTEGNVTITAKLTSDNSIYATCNVHIVASLTEATWHGYEFVSPQEGQTVFTYNITRSVDQKLTFTMTTDKNVVGFVAFININGTDHELTGYGAEHTASYTTDVSYEDNILLNCMWDFRSANYRETFNFTYYVGEENAALKILTLEETENNTSVISSFNNQEVALGIVNRSFAADKLYTLVLPFNADAAQTAEKLPGQLTKLNNTYVKDNGDLRVNFVNVDAIEAGVPYLYVPSTNVTNSIFENVTVSSTLVPTEPADGLAKYYGIYETKDADALKAITNGYVLGSDQYLYDVQDLPSTQTMKALRGYFVLNFPSLGAGAPKRIAKVVFNSNEDNSTTGIEDVQDGVQCTKRIENGMLYIIRDGKTYNVQGQLVK